MNSAPSNAITEPASRNSRCSSLGACCAFALTTLLSPLTVLAFSQGAPICEVNTLPLIEMSPTLANPAPEGWTLVIAERFALGRPLLIQLRNTDPNRRARGVLLWAKSGPATGAGSFALPGNGRWQHIPAPANCGLWAISHTDSQPKSQAELSFEWVSVDYSSAILRAFIIEDCSAPQGCRDQQALTPITLVQPALFFDGFEPPAAAVADPDPVWLPPTSRSPNAQRTD
ncbi:hypothetical protein [Aquimonas sp.]|jgi:hypothetical protein|uniref:hypothetical protein n=1 Tax=Aquimonas sp. TaxID=1872588 RepID=UPI0037C0B54D